MFVPSHQGSSMVRCHFILLKQMLHLRLCTWNRAINRKSILPTIQKCPTMNSMGSVIITDNSYVQTIVNCQQLAYEAHGICSCLSKGSLNDP